MPNTNEITADTLTDETIKAELSSTHPGGKFADLCRKALGMTTRRALTATTYGARCEVARILSKRSA